MKLESLGTRLDADASGYSRSLPIAAVFPLSDWFRPMGTQDGRRSTSGCDEWGCSIGQHSNENLSGTGVNVGHHAHALTNLKDHNPRRTPKYPHGSGCILSASCQNTRRHSAAPLHRAQRTTTCGSDYGLMGVPPVVLQFKNRT